MIFDFGWGLISLLLGLSSGLWLDLFPVALFLAAFSLRSRLAKLWVWFLAFASAFLIVSVGLGLSLGIIGLNLRDFSLEMNFTPPIFYLLAGLVSYYLALGELGLLPRFFLPRLLHLSRLRKASTKTAIGLGALLALPGVVSFESSLLLPLTAGLLAEMPLRAALIFLLYGLGRLLPLFVLLFFVRPGKNLLLALDNWRGRLQLCGGLLLIFLAGLVVVISLLILTGFSWSTGATLLIVLWFWPLWRGARTSQSGGYRLAVVGFALATTFLFFYVLPEVSALWSWARNLSQRVVSYTEESATASGSVVNFSFSPEPVLVGLPTLLIFSPVEASSNVPLSSDYQVAKIFLTRDDLGEFWVQIPSGDDHGLFTTRFVFPSPGRYKVWSVLTRGSLIRVFGHPPFEVLGGGVVAERFNGLNGKSIPAETLDLQLPSKIVAGQPFRLKFSPSESSLNWIIIKDDWQIIRLGRGEETIALPGAGRYRLFLENFKPMAFWLVVEPPDPVGNLGLRQLLLASFLVIGTAALLGRLVDVGNKS